MFSKAASLVLAVAFSVSACTTFQPVDTDEVNIPADYKYAAEVEAAKPDPAWWTGFGEPSLNGLVSEAMDSNESIEASLQRVEQARGALQIARAPLLPSINGSVNASLREGSGSGASSFQPSESVSAGVSASYELDLFGRNRAQARSAESQLAATIFNQQALALTVQSDVAASYFTLLALRDRIEVAQANIDATERILELVETQYDAGAVSGFDLARQRSAVASARARLRPLVQSARQTEHALAVLLGETPEAFAAPQGDLTAITTPAIETGLPSDLLLRRPDLLAAEAQLAAAEANIDAARAAFFPTIDLGASLTAQDLTNSSDLVSQLTAGLLQPIFAAGRLEGGLQQVRAQYLELAANYRQTILNSLRDVEDSLVSLEAAERQEEDLRQAAEEAGRAFEIAEVRYQAGADDLISVLDAQQNLLTAQDSLVQARQQRLTASVSLYRALGGGW